MKDKRKNIEVNLDDVKVINHNIVKSKNGDDLLNTEIFTKIFELHLSDDDVEEIIKDLLRSKIKPEQKYEERLDLLEDFKRFYNNLSVRITEKTNEYIKNFKKKTPDYKYAEYLTIDDVISKTTVTSRQSVYRMIKKGLVAEKDGKFTKFKREEFERFLNENPQYKLKNHLE